MVRDVLFYETGNGASPAYKFLRKLSGAPKDRFLEAFRLLRENQTVSPDLFQKMVNTDDLWEVRVRSRGDIYRMLCFFDGTRIVVVAHGFQKKTQKTPRQAIQTAEARKKDYFRRKHNEK